MIQYVLGIMGCGKTLYTILYTLRWLSLNPDCKIYANLHINLPNAVYTPYMYMPYNKLGKCLIICDDFYTLANLKGFITVMVNMSRKNDITIILTAQYYTMIPPAIRKISQYEVQCQYDEISDVLLFGLIDLDGIINFNYVKDAVKLAKNIYNTNEVVSIPTLKDIAREIIKYSNSEKDYDINLELYSNSESKRNNMRKIIKDLLL